MQRLAFRHDTASPRGPVTSPDARGRFEAVPDELTAVAGRLGFTVIRPEWMRPGDFAVIDIREAQLQMASAIVAALARGLRNAVDAERSE